MAIPYQTAKFKSANIYAMEIWYPTAKFNSHQYFQLYSMTFTTYFAPATLAASAACSLTLKDSTPRQPPRYRLDDIYII